MPQLKLTELSVKDHFVYFIRDRDAIRLAKAAGQPKPWTHNPILQQYRFCNVRRMDDKVSMWLEQHWYTPHYNHPNMLVACTIARHFNQPHALEHITELVFPKYCPKDVKWKMRSLKSGGITIFNGAYMVRGIGTADKTEMVIDKVCQPLVDKPPAIDTSSMQKSVEALLPYWGFSSFMAGQVVADLRWAMEGEWADRNTWAPIGPGSLRGMNRFMGRPTKQPLSQEQFLKELDGFIDYCEQRLPDRLTTRLEAIDWQNCLCEGDKYMRTVLGEGKPKQRYPGK